MFTRFLPSLSVGSARIFGVCERPVYLVALCDPKVSKKLGRTSALFHCRQEVEIQGIEPHTCKVHMLPLSYILLVPCKVNVLQFTLFERMINSVRNVFIYRSSRLTVESNLLLYISGKI